MRIEIAGITLTLMSEYSEEYVRALSAAADKLINQMPKSCTKLEAALLCLLDTLDEKLRMEEENKPFKEANGKRSSGPGNFENRK